MQPVSAPLSAVALDLASAFAIGAPAPEKTLDALAQLDRTAWLVEGYHVLEEEDGRRLVRLVLPQADGELAIEPPGIPQITLFAGGATTGNSVVLEVLEPGPNLEYAELRNLRLGISFDSGILRPVNGDGLAELVYTGSLRFYPDWSVRLGGDQSLSLSPCEVAGTGLIIEFRDVQFDLSSTNAVPGVQALGLGNDFQGIYAKWGTLTILPHGIFGANSGIQLTVQDLAIGQAGLTCKVEQYYELNHTNDQIDPSSALVGHLFDDQWQLGVSAVEVEVRHTLIQHFFVAGVLRIPFFDALFDVELGMRMVPTGGYDHTLHVESLDPMQMPIAHGSLGLSSFKLDGTLQPHGFILDGAIHDLTLDLDPILTKAESVMIGIVHGDERDELRLELDDVQLGPLGTLERASLLIREHGPEDSRTREVGIEARLSWIEIRDRLDLPSYFPAPPDDGEVDVLLQWQDGPAPDARKLVLRLSVDVHDVDQLWTFIPEWAKPEVRHARLNLEVLYESTADFSSASPSSKFTGKLSVDLELRLPPNLNAPGLELLTFHTGDAEGWIAASLDAGIDEHGSGYLMLSAKDLLSVDVQLPGLPQVEPPIHLALTNVEFDLHGNTEAEGKLILTGMFELRQISPPASVPIGTHLQQLFAPLEMEDLSGTAKLELGFKGEQAQLELSCDFDEATVDIEVFDLIANLSRGFVPPAGVPEPASEVELDLDHVQFSLRYLKMTLGSLDATKKSHISVELGTSVALAGLSVDGHLILSDEMLAIGVEQMRVPLRMPRFPIPVAELEHADWKAKLFALQQQIEQLEGQPDAESNKELARLKAQHFLLGQMCDVRRLVDPARVQDYQDILLTVLGVAEAATGLVHIESDVELVLKNVDFVIPFSDPRGIRIEGSAHLEGFDPDDPFFALGQVELGLGLSADRIFFFVKSLDEPIPLPDLGRYPGGSVTLSHFTIGYGYTRNSFSMTLAGKLELPEQLIKDADTSKTLGVGVVLPQHTSLGFRLDMVQLPGPLPPVPMIEFDLDMRTPGAPAIANTEVCQPNWDGLEMIVKGLYHSDLKQIAASPVLGVLPIPNARFDGDLMFGNETNGLTVVMDDFLFLAGLSTTPPIPIPFLAHPAQPYFDNFCVSLRLAGFGINFNLQRPFPGFSPLALFEVLGLLADPTMKINPQGALANSIRVTLSDAYITLPPKVLQLFPDAQQYTRKELNVTINLGTFISALQQAAETSGQIVDVMEDETRSLQQRLDDLADTPPELDLGAVLQAVPPELRKVALGASFAGFEARAVILLIGASDKTRLKHEFDLRDGTQTAQPATPGFALGSTPDSDELARFRPNIPESSGDARTFYPDEPHNSLFAGAELEGFDTEVLFGDEIPLPEKPMDGVVVGANVRVFRDQRFRFIGYVFEDDKSAKFGMASALDVEPLSLGIAGIEVKLPLELHGRLVLSGSANREGVTGSVRAEVHGTWRVIENVLTLVIGSTEEPVSLEIWSSGKFAAKGGVLVKMFNNGSATLLGTVDTSDTHCFVDGAFRYVVPDKVGLDPVVELNLKASGRIGPQQRFTISGDGSLRLFGIPLTQVRGTISESGAAVEATLDTGPAGRWFVGQSILNNCRLQASLAGWLDLRKTDYPEFGLLGSGELDLFGATVNGSVAIASQGGKISTVVDGHLTWQGREWLQGRIALDTDGKVSIEGRTSFTRTFFTFDLPDRSKAQLYLKVNVGGSFNFDAAKTAVGASISGDWQLGILFPNGQTMPLAMQEIPETSMGTPGSGLTVELLNLNVLKLLPFDAIDLPPAIDISHLGLEMPTGELTPKPGAEKLTLGYNDNVVKTPILRISGIPGRIPPREPSFSGPPEKDHWTHDIPVSWDVETKPITKIDLPNDFLQFLTTGTDYTLFLHWNGGKFELRLKNNQSSQIQSFSLT